MTSRLIVDVPPDFVAERAYALSFVLRESLGLEFKTRFARPGRYEIRVEGDPRGMVVRLPDVFMARPESWLSPASLPAQPRRHVADFAFAPFIRTKPSCPVLYGADRPRDEPDAHWFPIDVVGACFFLLTRYEELVSTERDVHGRFPLPASALNWDGGVDLPLVDEYVRMLGSVVEHLWPRINVAAGTPRIELTHDVDAPTSSDRSPRAVARSVLADVFVRRDTRLAIRRARAALDARRDDFSRDPNNTFEHIFRVSERAGLRSLFFMMAAQPSKFDRGYSLEHPFMKQLLRQIVARDHQIGLHPSYHGGSTDEGVRRELGLLQRAVTAAGGKRVTAARQHYLRWNNPNTWRSYVAAGLSRDCTLTFFERAGFRCGTCREYTAFDVMARVELPLRVSPLIMMECVPIAVEGLGLVGAADRIRGLWHVVSEYGGTLTLLWHNSELITADAKRTYEELVRSLTSARG